MRPCRERRRKNVALLIPKILAAPVRFPFAYSRALSNWSFSLAGSFWASLLADSLMNAVGILAISTFGTDIE